MTEPISMSSNILTYTRVAVPGIAKIISASDELLQDFKTGVDHAALAALDTLNYIEELHCECDGIPELVVYSTLITTLRALERAIGSLYTLNRLHADSADYAAGFAFACDHFRDAVVAFGDATHPDKTEAADK